MIRKGDQWGIVGTAGEISLLMVCLKVVADCMPAMPFRDVGLAQWIAGALSHDLIDQANIMEREAQ